MKRIKNIKTIVVMTALILTLGLSIILPKALSASAASNENLVYSLLTSKYGMNTAQASGIMASISRESGFNPNASNRTHYGLVQWASGRKRNLINYTKKNGLNYKTVQGQVAFLVHELKTSEKTAYNKIVSQSNNANGAYKAGYNFTYYYERPGNKASASHKRGNIAKTYFAKYNGKKVSTTNTPAASVRTTNTKYTAGKYKLNMSMTVRSAASTSSKSVGTIAKGTVVNVKSVSNGKWGLISYKGAKRYVSLKYSKRV